MAKILIPRSDSVSIKVIEPSDFEAFFSQDIINDYVKSGFALTAGSGLSVNIAIGLARLKGLFINNSTSSSKGSLTASSTNHIYITLARDSNSEAESWSFTSNTTGSTPTDSLLIGKAITNGSSVTSTDITTRETSPINLSNTTIPLNSIDEATLKVSNAPQNGLFLSAQSGNTGGLTWASNDFGNGSHGDVTISTDTTLGNSDNLRQYTNLTIDATKTLTCGTTTGKKWIFFATDSITINGTLNLNGVGAAGGNGGSGGGGGAGGSTSVGGTGNDGGAGGTGGDGYNQSSIAGGTNAAEGGSGGNSYTFANHAGGSGGAGNGGGGSASSIIDTTDESNWELKILVFNQLIHYGAGGNGGEGGGGGGGGGSHGAAGGNGGTGGSGGAGGNGGGCIILCAPTITFGTNGAITCAGLAGSNGNSGATGGAGYVGNAGGVGGAGSIIGGAAAVAGTNGGTQQSGGGGGGGGGSYGASGRDGFVGIIGNTIPSQSDLNSKSTAYKKLRLEY